MITEWVAKTGRGAAAWRSAIDTHYESEVRDNVQTIGFLFVYFAWK